MHPVTSQTPECVHRPLLATEQATLWSSVSSLLLSPGPVGYGRFSRLVSLALRAHSIDLEARLADGGSGQPPSGHAQEGAAALMVIW